MPDGQVASALEVMTGTTDAGAPIATDILVLPIYDAVRIRTGEHLVWPRPDRARDARAAGALPRTSPASRPAA